MALDDVARNLNTIGGQTSISSNATQNSKIIYPAIVRSVSDSSNMGRITAEIIDFDDNTGRQIPGKDKNDVRAKVAMPLMPGFLNVMPKVNEMVYILFENPSDQSSTRYWIGPVRSTRTTKSEFEGVESANLLNRTNTFTDSQNTNATRNTENFINQDNVFLKGKDDADVILKSREVLIRAGTFNDGTTNINIDTPCSIQLIQKDKNSERPFSQTNIMGSNINLISTDSSSKKDRALDEEGNLKDKSNVENNTNDRLNDFGENAKKLHPLVLGDELVKVLKIIIRFCLNHRHTPQEKPYATVEEIDLLNDLLADENIKVILSNSVRTN